MRCWEGEHVGNWHPNDPKLKTWLESGEESWLFFLSRGRKTSFKWIILCFWSRKVKQWPFSRYKQYETITEHGNFLSSIKWVFRYTDASHSKGFLRIPFSLLCDVTHLPVRAPTWPWAQLLIQTIWMAKTFWPSWSMCVFRCGWRCHLRRTRKDKERWALIGAEGDINPERHKSIPEKLVLSSWNTRKERDAGLSFR